MRIIRGEALSAADGGSSEVDAGALVGLACGCARLRVDLGLYCIAIRTDCVFA